MLTLPDVIVPILSPFAMLFTNPTWQKAQLLLVGVILTPGQRTVAAALRVMGRSDQDDYARYHEVLNRERCGRLARRPASYSCFCSSTWIGATVRWSSALTKPWSGGVAPGFRPEALTGMRCAPVATSWSRPTVCAGSP